jgi:hypothetical protein
MNFVLEDAARAAPAAPHSLAGLSYGEHFLIWVLRRIASGRGNCPLMAREFIDACGAEAGEARAAYGWFLEELARAGRRHLQLGIPGWPALTLDERLILAVFAAAQAEAPARLRAHLAWLFRGESSASLETAAGVVAAALARNGHRLPLPEAPLPATTGEAPALRSVAP